MAFAVHPLFGVPVQKAIVESQRELRMDVAHTVAGELFDHVVQRQFLVRVECKEPDDSLCKAARWWAVGHARSPHC